MASQSSKAPKGYHSVTPLLVVGDIPEAIDFYKRAFGAKDVYVAKGPDGRPMHAEIDIGDSRIMLTEENVDRGWSTPSALKGNCSSLYVYLDNVDAVYRQALGAGAKELMPVADMFWGDRTGEVRDPYGHRWSLATHKEDLTPEEMTRRAEEFFASMARP